MSDELPVIAPVQSRIEKALRKCIEVLSGYFIRGQDGWAAVHVLQTEVLPFVVAPSPPAASDRLDSSGWQPISSAPKDGTVLWGWMKLAGGPDRYHQDTIAWFENKYWEGGGAWVSRGLTCDPRFWMPLPSPPQEQGT